MQSDSAYTLSTDRMSIAFTSSGSIRSITPRYKHTSGKMTEMIFKGKSAPLLFFTHDTSSAVLTRQPQMAKSDTSVSIAFPYDNFTLIYTLSATSYLIHIEVVSPDPYSVRASLPIDKSAHQYPVALVKNRQQTISEGLVIHDTSSWFGVRNKFWTLLIAKPPAVLSVTSDFLNADLPMQKSRLTQYTVYAGPIDYHELINVDAVLTHLLYPLWFWMRWLSVALLQLFSLLMKLSGNTIIAILLLSISVKIILAPLYHLAQKLQRSVNRQKSRIAPRLAEIKKSYSGEIQTRKTLELYKEFGISPLYELKSLASAAIQIPVFFAAYHMLSEHIALSGIPFLWIQDISKPDALFTLPFSVAYFGNTFNLLPFIMTSITVLASSIHSDTSLSNQLHRQQRSSLLVMAALFFLLLYPSAAGMLLYWTMNNFLSLLSTLSSRFLRPLHPAITGAMQS